MKTENWWRGAIIYQIYPRSFFDSNKDGIGDLRGIESKLDYIESLGVDAIWISPFFKSPMCDFGYDIADYRDVDPIFGSLEDFDALIAEAHKRNLKIMIDQVLSHTSDQHQWFKESRTNTTNDKADWYVWADAKEDGSVPNNWLSVFGGSAWQWDDTRQQYYLHNFLTSQPDLNYHCPALREAMLGEVQFWLDRGVDGFRFDAINYCFHDNQLRDNPFKPVEERKGRGFSEDNPYAAQYHHYDNNRPEILHFLQDLRQLLDRYPDIGTVGEINTEDSLKSISEYTSNNRLHLGYSFELLADEDSISHIKQTVEALEAHLEDNSMGCWAISNHDVKRVVSRWCKKDGSPAAAKMLSTMIASLRGTICTYQGEELGLPEADVAFEDLQDPFGKRFWPEFKGRDGCRTPIPWSATTPHAGFTEAKPWLPVAETHNALSVESQVANPSSVLNNYKALNQWRRTQDCLRYGDITFSEVHKDILLFTRTLNGKALLCAFNFSDTELSLTNTMFSAYKIIDQSFISASAEKTTIRFPAYGIFFAELQ